MKKTFLYISIISIAVFSGCSYARNENTNTTAVTTVTNESTTTQDKKVISSFEETVDNVYTDHYRGVQQVGEVTYAIIREPLDSNGEPTSETTDTLIRFTPEEGETELYSYYGLDFLAGSERIAVLGENDTIHVLSASTGEELAVYDTAQLNAVGSVRMSEWSSEEENIWLLVGNAGVGSVHRVDVESGETETYEFPQAVSISEIAIDADNGIIVYSDYPPFLETADRDAFEQSGETVTLYIHTLFANNTQKMLEQKSTPFNPAFVDGEIQYTDEMGESKKISLSTYVSQ